MGIVCDMRKLLQFKFSSSSFLEYNWRNCLSYAMLLVNIGRVIGSRMFVGGDGNK